MPTHNLKKFFNAIYNFIVEFFDAIEKRHAVLNLFFTAIALLVAYWLYKETQLQVKVSQDAVDMARQSDAATNLISQKSIALAESSFVITKRSVDIAQKNFEIGNRPYLGVSNFTFYTSLPDEVERAEFMVYNYGKIPALQIKTTTQFAVTKEEPLTQFILAQAVPAPKSPSLTPNASYAVSQKLYITQEEINKIKLGKSYLYFYGEISYTDIFKTPHTTTFCFEFNPNSPVGFDYNETYNDVK